MSEQDDPRVPGDAPIEYDRRRGPRRASSDQSIADDRRRSDRRKVPGLTALIDAILGIRRVKAPGEPAGKTDEQPPSA